MGKIYCVMGKSSSGKDSIYREIMERKLLPLNKIVPYTTRPIRDGELADREYHFCNEDKVKQLTEENRIVELRAYNTVHGVWKYFTVDDGQINLDKNDYLYIVTLEGYRKIREYYGAAKVEPIYIDVEDGERLKRAIAREEKQKVPQYEEMCRRFLADARDFSDEKLTEAQIDHVFTNKNLEDTIQQVVDYISGDMEADYGDESK